MDCDFIKQNCEAYLDSELTLSDRRDFEEHIHDCPDCKALLESFQALSSAIQQTDYSQAPYALKRRIKTGLRDISGEDDRIYNKFQLFSFSATSAVLASFAVWVVMFSMPTSLMQTPAANELIAAHVRSLMVDHAVDIMTSDSHVVKPWFNGKLDFSPTVINLKSRGFPLVGGRLEYLMQKPTAALVYKRRSHLINLFAYRLEDDPGESRHPHATQQGYNLVQWDRNGLRYWAVSDLNINELKQFSQLIDDNLSKESS